MGKEEKEHPPSASPIRFRTSDGIQQLGFFIKDINKYVRNVNRWKDVDSGKWYDDRDVIGWEDIPSWPS